MNANLIAVSAKLRLAHNRTTSASVIPPLRNLQYDEFTNNQLFKENRPSVVFIDNLVAQQDALTLDVLEESQSFGSGFIWDTKGHIVTNYHVICDADNLSVTLADETKYKAKVVGYDQDNDVAVLHIDAPKEKLRPIKVGISSNLLIGQKVYAIGHPYDWRYRYTLTAGIISGLRREILSPENGKPIKDAIQTDTSINPGNSGGPLLDSYGNMIGIITSIISLDGASCGIGFAIPVDTVKGIVERFVKFGKATRPIWGI